MRKMLHNLNLEKITKFKSPLNNMFLYKPCSDRSGNYIHKGYWLEMTSQFVIEALTPGLKLSRNDSRVNQG